MANKLPYRGNSRRKNNNFFNSGIERLLTRVDNLEKVERTGEEGGGCAANIGFAYQIDDSASVPGTALIGGSTTTPGTYDMNIMVTDYKATVFSLVTSFTDSFSIETGRSWNGTGVYDVNISVTNQADAECGPYCSIQTAVPPSIRQDILALEANCP
tara:strand:- start:3863 stop:4333 length:471 start_codon:yes stop_codon:yes gene_type:complete